MSGGNGSGFGSPEEARLFHAQRLMPRATNLDYTHAARTPDEVRREALPQSPLDGQQYQTPPQQTIPQPIVEPVPIRELAPPMVKKSLKEIAMERGQIPRKGQ